MLIRPTFVSNRQQKNLPVRREKKNASPGDSFTFEASGGYNEALSSMYPKAGNFSKRFTIKTKMFFPFSSFELSEVNHHLFRIHREDEKHFESHFSSLMPRIQSIFNNIRISLFEQTFFS
jgi:hypothetical protein